MRGHQLPQPQPQYVRDGGRARHYMLESVCRLLRWPQAITELQRRAAYRTPVPAGSFGGHQRARRMAARRSCRAAVSPFRHAGQYFVKWRLVRLNQPAAIDWVEGELLGLEVSSATGKAPQRPYRAYGTTRPIRRARCSSSGSN